ncbi:AP2-like ethylene-responsive transcription factor ANT-like [Pyrus ussuriensis x Pyrus communis]|uniref:AP2-like ethylene-responsive transcription factor ANT-like n=1 Tax=Pyrus ussuriensis x Pyrus communis TaxID=2448454 RepID=A0A5N5FDX8_9ROSA|nr:AP2-like ethylene-responsive transcription factor ANT-like [Pyrus ussuriensis x Pyrus communis]
MKNVTKQKYAAHLLRKTNGFSRGASMYRRITSRRHQHGRWLARIGSVARNKDLYLRTLNLSCSSQAYPLSISLCGASPITACFMPVEP